MVNDNTQELKDLVTLEDSILNLINVINSRINSGEMGKVDYVEELNDVIKGLCYNKEGSGYLQKSGLLNTMLNKHNKDEIVRNFAIQDGMFHEYPLMFEGANLKRKTEELSGVNDNRVDVKILRIIQWINISKRYIQRCMESQIGIRGNFNEDDFFSPFKKYTNRDKNIFLSNYVKDGSKKNNPCFKDKHIVDEFKNIFELCGQKGIDEDWCMKMIASKNVHDTMLRLKNKLIDEFLRYYAKNGSDIIHVYKRDDVTAKEKGLRFDTLLGASVENFSEPFEFHVNGATLKETEKIVGLDIPVKSRKDAQLKTGIQIDLKKSSVLKAFKAYIQKKKEISEPDVI